MNISNVLPQSAPDSTTPSMLAHSDENTYEQVNSLHHVNVDDEANAMLSVNDEANAGINVDDEANANLNGDDEANAGINVDDEANANLNGDDEANASVIHERTDSPLVTDTVQEPRSTNIEQTPPRGISLCKVVPFPTIDGFQLPHQWIHFYKENYMSTKRRYTAVVVTSDPIKKFGCENIRCTTNSLTSTVHCGYCGKHMRSICVHLNSKKGVCRQCFLQYYANSTGDINTIQNSSTISGTGMIKNKA